MSQTPQRYAARSRGALPDNDLLRPLLRGDSTVLATGWRGVFLNTWEEVRGIWVQAGQGAQLVTVSDKAGDDRDILGPLHSPSSA